MSDILSFSASHPHCPPGPSQNPGEFERSANERDTKRCADFMTRFLPSFKKVSTTGWKRRGYWASISLVISVRVVWSNTPDHLRKTSPWGVMNTVVGMVMTEYFFIISRSPVKPVG